MGPVLSPVVKPRYSMISCAAYLISTCCAYIRGVSAPTMSPGQLLLCKNVKRYGQQALEV